MYLDAVFDVSVVDVFVDKLDMRTLSVSLVLASDTDIQSGMEGALSACIQLLILVEEFLLVVGLNGC